MAPLRASDPAQYRTKDNKRISISMIRRHDVGQAVDLWNSLASERRYLATECVSEDQRARKVAQ